ncbi:MAG: siderophore-interacting protein [Bowdeniella nasicola]|nr:siderophore-interacting protein [Bowdeniella nasicola]
MARTSRPLTTHPIRVREAEVVEAWDLSPAMRRVRLQSEELTAQSGFTSTGWDDHIKIIVRPGVRKADIGIPRGDRFEWNREIFSSTRSYTVRAWDGEAGVIDVDFVRHRGGLAAAWADAARPGDTIFIAGPKSCAGFSPHASYHLFVGDETALPAIARALEELPADAQGLAILEVPSTADRQDLTHPAGVEVRYVVRDGVSAGHSRLLADEVETLHLPEGTFAFVAGEALSITRIRRHLRSLLPKEDVEVVGYWRRTGDTDPLELTSRIYHMADLGPPLLLRVVVTLGLPALLAEGLTSPEQLAAATGINPALLPPLLDAMTLLGLLDSDGALSDLGGVLLEEEAESHLNLANPRAQGELGLLKLPEVLRTGRGLGGVIPTVDEGFLPYLVGPVRELPELAGATRILVAGSATLAADLPDGEAVSDVPSAGPADAAVLAGVLGSLDDERAAAYLSGALRVCSVVVLLEATSDRAVRDKAVAALSLASLVSQGRPLRSTADYRRLAQRADARLHVRDIGWGFGLIHSALVVTLPAQEDDAPERP